MDARLKRLPAYFYRLDSGKEPVREWLKALEPEDRKVIGEDIKDVEFSWPIGNAAGSSARPRVVGSAQWTAAGAGLRGFCSV
jgi:hypothetical protein